jgi:hypothetical protein
VQDFSPVKRAGYRVALLVAVLAVCGCRPFAPPPAPAPPERPKAEVPATSFEATAYSIEGETVLPVRRRARVSSPPIRRCYRSALASVCRAPASTTASTQSLTRRALRSTSTSPMRRGEAHRQEQVSVEVLERGNGQRSSAPVSK